VKVARWVVLGGGLRSCLSLLTGTGGGALLQAREIFLCRSRRRSEHPLITPSGASTEWLWPTSSSMARRSYASGARPPRVREPDGDAFDSKASIHRSRVPSAIANAHKLWRRQSVQGWQAKGGARSPCQVHSDARRIVLHLISVHRRKTFSPRGNVPGGGGIALRRCSRIILSL